MRKKVQWNSVRVEATWQDAAPVRLITNQGEIRIMLRRRISDCGVLGSRIFKNSQNFNFFKSNLTIQQILIKSVKSDPSGDNTR